MQALNKQLYRLQKKKITILHDAFAIYRIITVEDTPNLSYNTFAGKTTAYIYCDESHGNCVLAVYNDRRDARPYAMFRCASSTEEVETFICQCKRRQHTTQVEAVDAGQCIRLTTPDGGSILIETTCTYD
jgi:hypothetical protein